VRCISTATNYFFAMEQALAADARAHAATTTRPAYELGSGYPVAFTVEDLQGFVDGPQSRTASRWRSTEDH